MYTCVYSPSIVYKYTLISTYLCAFYVIEAQGQGRRCHRSWRSTACAELKATSSSSGKFLKHVPMYSPSIVVMYTLISTHLCACYIVEAQGQGRGCRRSWRSTAYVDLRDTQSSSSKFLKHVHVPTLPPLCTCTL